MADNNDKLVFGGNMMLFIGSGSTKQPLAYSNNASISFVSEMIEISSKDSGNSKEYIAGTKEWNASTDGLVAFSITGATNSMETVYSLYDAGQKINLVFAQTTGTKPLWTVDATKKNWSGSAYIESLDVSAGKNEFTTYSIKLKGSGDIVLN